MRSHAASSGASSCTSDRRVAPELEQHALLAGDRLQVPADLRAPGERQRREAVVAHERLGHRVVARDAPAPRLVPGAPASADALGQQERRQRRLRRGLEHDGAAARERGRDLVGDEVEREVERARWRAPAPPARAPSCPSSRARRRRDVEGHHLADDAASPPRRRCRTSRRPARTSARASAMGLPASRAMKLREAVLARLDARGRCGRASSCARGSTRVREAREGLDGGDGGLLGARLVGQHDLPDLGARPGLADRRTSSQARRDATRREAHHRRRLAAMARMVSLATRSWQRPGGSRAIQSGRPGAQSIPESSENSPLARGMSAGLPRAHAWRSGRGERTMSTWWTRGVQLLGAVALVRSRDGRRGLRRRRERRGAGRRTQDPAQPADGRAGICTRRRREPARQRAEPHRHHRRPATAAIESLNGAAVTQAFTVQGHVRQRHDGDAHERRLVVRGRAADRLRSTPSGLYTANGSLGGVVAVQASYKGQNATATLDREAPPRSRTAPTCPGSVQTQLGRARARPTPASSGPTPTTAPCGRAACSRRSSSGTAAPRPTTTTSTSRARPSSSTQFTTATARPRRRSRSTPPPGRSSPTRPPARRRSPSRAGTAPRRRSSPTRPGPSPPRRCAGTIYYWSNNLGRVLRIKPGAAQPDDFAEPGAAQRPERSTRSRAA